MFFARRRRLLLRIISILMLVTFSFSPGGSLPLLPFLFARPALAASAPDGLGLEDYWNYVRFDLGGGWNVAVTPRRVAASTGASGTAMVACGAHHLADVLPVLGMSAAVVFLNEYRTQLLWLGIAANAAGTAYLVRLLLRHRRSSGVSPDGGPRPGTGR